MTKMICETTRWGHVELSQLQHDPYFLSLDQMRKILTMTPIPSVIRITLASFAYKHIRPLSVSSWTTAAAGISEYQRGALGSF